MGLNLNENIKVIIRSFRKLGYIFWLNEFVVRRILYIFGVSDRQVS